MIFRKRRTPNFLETIMRQTSSSNPAAGRGKMPVTTEGMDAIRNTKTMAGSPDADHCDQRRAILRMVFVF